MTSEEIVQFFYFLPKIGTFIFGLCGVRALPVAAGINVVAIVLAKLSFPFKTSYDQV